MKQRLTIPPFDPKRAFPPLVCPGCGYRPENQRLWDRPCEVCYTPYDFDRSELVYSKRRALEEGGRKTDKPARDGAQRLKGVR